MEKYLAILSLSAFALILIMKFLDPGYVYILGFVLMIGTLAVMSVLRMLAVKYDAIDYFMGWFTPIAIGFLIFGLTIMFIYTGLCEQALFLPTRDSCNFPF